MRTYLYGITEGTGDTPLAVAGVDGVSPVHTVEYDGIMCVVSDYHDADIHSLPREKLLRYLLRHQEVIELFMQAHTVLPVKFGTLVNSPREVHAILSQGHRRLAEALAFAQDKVEVDVAATWDTSQVLQEISREEEVVRMKKAIARKEQPTQEDLVHLGQMVKAFMDWHRKRHRERLVERLRQLSVDVASNALVSDEMVMNVAFWVERARREEFEERIHELDGLFQNEITFKVIGPLPPYSFSTVEATRLEPNQVEEACRVLRLGDVISEAEVRRAYRQMAADANPSSTPRDGSASGQLACVRQASELLLRYCRTLPESSSVSQSRELARLETSPLFAVEIRGSKSDEVEPERFGGLEPVLERRE